MNSKSVKAKSKHYGSAEGNAATTPHAFLPMRPSGLRNIEHQVLRIGCAANISITLARRSVLVLPGVRWMLSPSPLLCPATSSWGRARRASGRKHQTNFRAFSQHPHIRLPNMSTVSSELEVTTLRRTSASCFRDSHDLAEHTLCIQ